MRKIIETGLPLQLLQWEAGKEKGRKGHPGSLHTWWKRSPVLSSRYLLRTLLEDMSDDGTGIMGKEMPHVAEMDISYSYGKKLPVICDPFAGYGGLVLAAQELGLPVKAGDINPVAVLLTKAVAEIPALFKDRKAVNPGHQAIFYTGMAGLAEDVSYYGRRLEKAAFHELSALYPPVNGANGIKEEPFSYVWVRTMTCPNPACSCEMPLASSFILSQTKNKEFWAEPVYEKGNLHFKIHQGLCPKEKRTNKHGSRGSKFICPHCGMITTDDNVVDAGHRGELRCHLMAVAAQTEEGRIFLAPDEDQLQAAENAKPGHIPQGRIPDNARWFSPPRFGFKEFSDVYLPRQLCLMETFCRLISSIVKEAQEDGRKAGMEPGKALDEGGQGYIAYGQAIGVYLSLIISKMADYQSACCSWDHRSGNIRSTFTRQAMPMTWVIGEGNPFSTPIGHFQSLLKNTVDTILHLKGNGRTEVRQEDALTASFPQNAVLFTEIPYYDHVGYADLSDYFYLWLKECLKDIYPHLFSAKETEKNELSSIPEHYGGDGKKAIDAYQRGLGQLFSHFYPYTSTEYPSLVFYECQKLDLNFQKDGELPPLGHLLDSIMKAGFMITALWPLESFRTGQPVQSVRCAVVFRKREKGGPVTTRRGFIAALYRELSDLLRRALIGDYAKEDFLLIALGMGLQIFTSFQSVLNADGTRMSLQEVFPIIDGQHIMNFVVHNMANETGEESL